jgi:hypothetical protein
MGMMSLGGMHAKAISTNAGIIPGTPIRYVVTLEPRNGHLQMKFAFTNDAEKAYHLWEPSVHVPGSAAIFCSTDITPIPSDQSDWVTTEPLASVGPSMFIHTIKSGASVEMWLPLGLIYNKIYKRVEKDNVYVYWGLTMRTANRNGPPEKGENKTKLTFAPLPRIGGMLTLPKGTKIKD